MTKRRTSALDTRRMMERAVEVMRRSVPELRPDGSPSPKVGTVLARPDGSLEAAARGELRQGNHAEFILLERKCIAERLDECTLFTTLEPCLNRNHPKRGCARHIVSARIKEVYVGVEDDNPAVAGKGIAYLRRHGVEIHLFDRDLQETILAENAEFLEWARKQFEKPEEPAIKLSKYEDAVTAVGWGELSKEALTRYRDRAGISPEIGSREFQRLLQRQGLLVEERDAPVPSGFGLLLFGKRPRDAVPQAGLLARADLPDGTSARREFGEALVLIPGLLEEWLNTVLPSTIDRSRMERREQVDLPFEMIREAVVNALIHCSSSGDGQRKPKSVRTGGLGMAIPSAEGKVRGVCCGNVHSGAYSTEPSKAFCGTWVAEQTRIGAIHLVRGEPFMSRHRQNRRIAQGIQSLWRDKAAGDTINHESRQLSRRSGVIPRFAIRSRLGAGSPMTAYCCSFRPILGSCCGHARGPA